MKEYELINKYGTYPSTPVEAPFDLVSQAIYSKRPDLLQLEQCRAAVNEVFDFLELKRRYDSLLKESKDALLVIGDGFELDKHKFETLDEVERALKLKAFL